jgi:hypothetical protein
MGSTLPLKPTHHKMELNGLRVWHVHLSIVKIPETECQEHLNVHRVSQVIVPVAFRTKSIQNNHILFFFLHVHFNQYLSFDSNLPV